MKKKAKKKRLRHGLTRAQERRQWEAFLAKATEEAKARKKGPVDVFMVESLYLSWRVAPTGKAGHPVNPDRVVAAALPDKNASHVMSSKTAEIYRKLYPASIVKRAADTAAILKKPYSYSSKIEYTAKAASVVSP